MTQPAAVFAEPSGVVRIWNSGAESLFGHSAAEAIGQTLDFIVPPEYRERHWAGFRAAMAASDGNIDHGSFSRNRATGAMAVFSADDETAPPLPRL
jgi:PAS domain S-box-containing protein